MDAATGKVRWTYKTQAEIKSSPVVVGDKVLIGSCDGHLYGLNAATGKFLWKVSTDNYVHATPAIWNGVAYFGGCDEVFHGVRISDGVRVVSLATEAYTAASPAIAAGIAYYGTFANEVVAVDIAAKKVKWRFVDPDRQFPFYSSAALSNGVAVLGGRDKNVRAIDMATGKQRWVFPTRARVESSPAVAGTRGCRFQRRQALCAGPGLRQEGLGVRSRRADHRLTCHLRRPNHHRRRRRATLRLRSIMPGHERPNAPPADQTLA